MIVGEGVFKSKCCCAECGGGGVARCHFWGFGAFGNLGLGVGGVCIRVGDNMLYVVWWKPL